MLKKYLSKVSYGLLIFIFLIFYGPLIWDFANSKHSLSEFKQRLINTPLTKVECFAMLTGEVKKEELNQFVKTISNLWQ